MAISAGTAPTSMHQQLMLQQQQQPGPSALLTSSSATTNQVVSTAAQAQSSTALLTEDPEQQELELQRQRLQTELQHKENSCRLLVVICRYFPNLVISYDKAIIQVLLDILKDPNSLLSSYALQGTIILFFH